MPTFSNEPDDRQPHRPPQPPPHQQHQPPWKQQKPQGGQKKNVDIPPRTLGVLIVIGVMIVGYALINEGSKTDQPSNSPTVGQTGGQTYAAPTPTTEATPGTIPTQTYAAPAPTTQLSAYRRTFSVGQGFGADLRTLQATQQSSTWDLNLDPTGIQAQGNAYFVKASAASSPDEDTCKNASGSQTHLISIAEDGVIDTRYFCVYGSNGNWSYVHVENIEMQTEFYSTTPKSVELEITTWK